MKLTSLHPPMQKLSALAFRNLFHICAMRTMLQGISCVLCFKQLSRQIWELKLLKSRKKNQQKKICSSLLQKCKEYAFKKWKEKISNIKLWINVQQPLIDMFMPNSLDILILYWKHLFVQVKSELPCLQ